MSTAALEYPGNARVYLGDFTCQPDESGFVIGSLERGEYYAIPKEAVALLQWFHQGLTLREVQDKYHEAYGETPDLNELLKTLEDGGLAEVKTEDDEQVSAISYEFHEDDRFLLENFSCEPGDDGFVIGPTKAGEHFAVPVEAVALLQWFHKGYSLGEATTAYIEKYDESPELEDFLVLLLESGLAKRAPADGVVSPGPKVRYHFENVSQETARAFFSKRAMLAYGLVACASVVAMIAYPEIIPSRGDLIFTENTTLNMLALMVVSTVGVFFHELYHLLAARAQGVPSRIGISHRMWIIVAETDMTGVWGIPKKDRYLPFLAGPIFDLVASALAVLALALLVALEITLNSGVFQFVKAFAISSALRIVWQCYLFVRTDFYYVFTTYFNCRNLMSDTKDYMWNNVKKLFKRDNLTDQSAIPENEMKVISRYTYVYIGGRLIAFAVLFFVGIPVMYGYLKIVYENLSYGPSHDLYRFLDSLFMMIVSLGTFAIGMGMWVRSFWLKRNKTANS